MTETAKDMELENAVRDLLLEASTQGVQDEFLVRRRWQRHCHDSRLEWRCEDDELHPATLADVSSGGLAVWVREKIPRGTEIHIRRWPGARGDHGWISGVVRHCEQGLKGYLVGVRFDAPVEFSFSPPVVEQPVENLAAKRMPRRQAAWPLWLLLLTLLGASGYWAYERVTLVT